MHTSTAATKNQSWIFKNISLWYHAAYRQMFICGTIISITKL